MGDVKRCRSQLELAEEEAKIFIISLEGYLKSGGKEFPEGTFDLNCSKICTKTSDLYPLHSNGSSILIYDEEKLHQRPSVRIYFGANDKERLKRARQTLVEMTGVELPNF